MNKSEEYLFNPLNGFSLIRRMHNDWPQIELFMTKPVGEGECWIQEKKKENFKWNDKWFKAEKNSEKINVFFFVFLKSKCYSLKFN